MEPPGAALPVVVTVTAGSEITQDITLQGQVMDGSDLYEPHSFDTPAAIPGSGIWSAVLNGVGDVDWYSITVGAGRTVSVEATAVCERSPSTTMTLPVIGIWKAEDAVTEAPLLSQTYFNAGMTGMTRAQTSLPAGAYKLAFTDARGDGRPDFLYRARVLYADKVSPAHALGGTVLTITGFGFNTGLIVRVGTSEAALLSFAPGRLMVAAPLLADGTYTLTIEDPETGASASMDNAVRYGGASNDTLQLLNGGNPGVAVGTPAPYPFRVRVMAADGVTAVSGASVRFQSPTSSVLLQPCNTQDCTIATDGAGEASAWMLVRAEGSTTLTATLASGARVFASVTGIRTSLSVTATPPKIYVAKNTAAVVSLLARVAGNGALLAGRTVEFTVMLGTGTLTAASATSDPSGEAKSRLVVANMSGEVRVSACVGVAPQTSCDIFYVYAVSTSGGTKLVKAGGDDQYVVARREFLPVSVRMTALGDPPNAVSGATVKFQMVAYKQTESTRIVNGEVVSGHYPSVVAIASEEVTANTDGWGLASYTPRVSEAGALIQVQATSGTGSVEFTLHTWEADSPATLLEQWVPDEASKKQKVPRLGLKPSLVITEQ